MASENREYAIFPMSVMNITQGMESGTHAGSFAIDIAGRDSGKEWAFAPFTGVIKKKYPNGNTIWIESIYPVEYADGTVDYMTVAMTHDNNIDRLKVGQVINQGVNFYQEGTAGNATGNHIHLGVGRGKYSGTGWYQNRYGYWVINNEIKPYDALYLSGTEVINGNGYPWKAKGVQKMIQTNEDVDKLYLSTLHRYPESDDVRKNWFGVEWPTALDRIRSSEEWLDQNHILLVSYNELKNENAKLKEELSEESEYEVATVYVKKRRD